MENKQTKPFNERKNGRVGEREWARVGPSPPQRERRKKGEGAKETTEKIGGKTQRKKEKPSLNCSAEQILNRLTGHITRGAD